jgi:mono/diheme cytochrome c family protein
MMMQFNSSNRALGLFAACALMIQVASAVDYEREIRPILEENCLDCHGPDKQKSELRVDQRSSLILGGDSGIASIVPGDAKKSHLLDLIKGTDPDDIMPPKGDPLTKAQIELIEKWIVEGANWPGQMDQVAKLTTDHWSFQAVKMPVVPAGAKNPVDGFLATKLKEAGIDANGPADARSLIRRVSVVLTGLPPKPAQVKIFDDNFSKDADKAYSELVENLLGSKHFGERWAQHWLDVIRWAESNGSEANLYRKNAWLYRDYVVRAFNEDLPYDQFVREQIAGDSLGSGDATGFLVAGPHVPAATVGREPLAIRQARADRMDEIMQTVGASIMGVTVGCARCHNHKFDPITISDYYSMTGVFQDVEFGSRFPEFKPDHPRRQRGEQLWKSIAKNRRTLKAIGGWEENWGAFREMHFKPVTTKAIRIKFKMGNVGLDELEVFGPENYGENLALKRRGTKLSGFPIKGVDGRNPMARVHDGQYGTMAWRAKRNKDSNEQPYVQYDFEKAETLSRLRLSSNREYFYDTDYLTKKPYLARYEYDVHILKSDGTWQPWVGTWFVNKQLDKEHPERKPALAEIQKLIGTLAEEGPRPSFVGRFVRPQITHVFHRGSPENPRDEVAPAAPAILDGDLKLTSKAPGSKRRAEFAKWISSPDNPLTARVMVNRLWHHVFGSGLVTTTSDFGKAGAPPTHPALLDWLASEFVTPTQSAQSGVAPWSMKGMIRLLVMSDAFRRSSLPSDAGLKADANAMLLWRYPPQRVSAEVLRDGILQASGKLDTTIGGRSYRIHNEKKTYAQWQVVDNHGEHTWRRMLYQERMRRVDDKIFTAFDFPDCGQVRAKRPVSTTPLQALNLMNSDFVVEQAGHIAARAVKEAGEGNLKTAVRRAFALLLVRQPDRDELTAAVEIAKNHGLEVVCRGLINANEFAFMP